MPERGHPEVFQVLVRQVRQNTEINVVLNETVCVFPKP